MIKILHFADAHIDIANHGRQDPQSGLSLRAIRSLKARGIRVVVKTIFMTLNRAELAGINLVGMKRAGMEEEQIGRIKQAYKVIFRSNLGLQEALAELAAELAGYPEVDHFIEFLKGSQRGITR